MQHGWCSELNRYTTEAGSCPVVSFRRQHTLKLLGGLVNTESWATPKVSPLVALEWTPRICISNKFPDGATIACLGTTV